MTLKSEAPDPREVGDERDADGAQAGGRAQRANTTNGAQLEPCEATIAEFIAFITDAYDGREGLIEIAWDAGGALKRARLFRPDQTDDMLERAVTENRADANVYIGPALRRADAPQKHAADADVIASRFAWADFDDEGALDAALEKFEVMGVAPNWVTITGEIPHRRGQCWWRLKEDVPLDQLRALIAAVATRFNGDPAVKNVGRVMRVAGSNAWPRKPGRVPELTRALHERTRVAPYAFANLRDLLAPLHANGAATEPKHSNGAGLATPHPASGWGQAALERACTELANTTPSGGDGKPGRNVKLNKEAFGLGQIVGAGLLDRAVVEARLWAAARQCGLDDAEIATVIPRVIEEGAREPRGPNNSAPADGDDEDKRSAADAIVAAAQPGIVRLFRDARSIAWATIHAGKRIDTVRVMSRRFESFLRGAFYRATNKTARGEALKQAAAHFETEALFSGETDEPRIRVAETDDTIYLDLADDEGRAVEITAGGWRVVDQSPVPFYRPNGLRALPLPERGGKLEDVLKILNLKRPAADDTEAVDSFVLLAAWLCAALRPRGPYPVLVLRGPPGSAKTTAAEIIRNLIDPAKPMTRNLPDTERDLFIATDAVHVVAIDNVSSISPAMSDALCRLATGGGYATRSLFTDGEEAIFEASRPVILNGLGAFVTRGDLQDRALTIELTPIEPGARRKKQEIDREIEKACPRLLGALLEAVAHGLKRVPTVKVTELPRMADFAHWGVACESAFANEGDFLKAWKRAAESALPDDLAADPFAAAIIDMLRACPAKDGNHLWEGAGKALATEINPDGRNRDLPKSGRGVSAALDRSRPLLGRAGVTVRKLVRKGTERPVELKLAEQPSQPSQPSQAKAANGFPRDDLYDDPRAAAGQSSQHDGGRDDLAELPLQSSRQSSQGNANGPLGNDVRDGGDDLSGTSSRALYEGEL